ncbi:hypothetical protein CEUSTIGMA_g12415.t1 [Chlamydomonas eustigma]|uniref:Uncharacterized protein n=1 Tax=Chlamydomonas eustigma TaxID=1157962 RepID=A0A250XPI0_9CHLO|nr:hypothetical protein CEUSTIGMA_g12415.t1 [Chlamydomonas eustigma]|eukprot:GAX84994.1 hypothetical protein CEUSTIGMA_g12415.t1 [Chlamydomonas eustigma]
MIFNHIYSKCYTRSCSEVLTQGAHGSYETCTAGLLRMASTSAVDWDWSYVLGKKKGRKPAIKRPQRHQWLFCNPKYDAHAPLPSKILPPHAPPSAADVDDRRLFRASLGQRFSEKSRKGFIRFLKLREVDWREAFQKGLAEHVAEHKKAQKMMAEQLRQRAWKEYRDSLFQKALHQPQQ